MSTTTRKSRGRPTDGRFGPKEPKVDAPNEIGRWVRDKRVAKGWTQVKLAHELRCVGFRMVMRWEAGQAPPSMEASQALARVFRCRLEHVCEMVLRSATRIRNVPAGKGAVV